jgi:hypothetical protein
MAPGELCSYEEDDCLSGSSSSSEGRLSPVTKGGADADEKQCLSSFRQKVEGLLQGGDGKECAEAYDGLVFQFSSRESNGEIIKQREDSTTQRSLTDIHLEAENLYYMDEVVQLLSKSNNGRLLKAMGYFADDNIPTGTRARELTIAGKMFVKCGKDVAILQGINGFCVQILEFLAEKARLYLCAKEDDICARIAIEQSIKQYIERVNKFVVENVDGLKLEYALYSLDQIKRRGEGSVEMRHPIFGVAMAHSRLIGEMALGIWMATNPLDKAKETIMAHLRECLRENDSMESDCSSEPQNEK